MPDPLMRHLDLPDTHNIRDLGGYTRQGGGGTQWRRLLRGEALHDLTGTSIESLLREGLVGVIDLRGPHETSATPHPFARHDDVAYSNIALFDALAPITMSQHPFDMAQRYCDAIDGCGPRLAQVLRAIADAPPGLVLFHCTAGKDRTGIVAALLLEIVGVARTDIAADYALTASADALIGKLRHRALSLGGDHDHIERVLASDGQTILTMLTHIDARHGGLIPYLHRIGITPADIVRLSDRLCA